MSAKDLIDARSFIVLAIKAAKANGIVVEEEKELIRKYCAVAGCDEGEAPEESSISMAELTFFFRNLTMDEKLQILSEVLRVMYADHCFDESECNFVYDLAARLDIAEEDVNRLVALH